MPLLLYSFPFPFRSPFKYSPSNINVPLYQYSFPVPFKLLYIFVDERQKLKLVKYNKSLQKYIDINIINYKHFTGNYITLKLNSSNFFL